MTFTSGARLLHGGGNSRGQARAADGDQDLLHVRKVLEDFQPQGAVSGHRHGVLPRVDGRHPPFTGDALHRGLAVEGFPAKTDFGPVAPRGIDLVRACPLRHDDHDRHAHGSPGIGERLSEVPR